MKLSAYNPHDRVVPDQGAYLSSKASLRISSLACPPGGLVVQSSKVNKLLLGSSAIACAFTPGSLGLSRSAE